MRGADAVLVPSVPGTHKGARQRRYGFFKLEATLRAEPLHSQFRHAPVLAQCSSLGSLNRPWLDRFTLACAPPEAATEALWQRVEKELRSKVDAFTLKWVVAHRPEEVERAAIAAADGAVSNTAALLEAVRRARAAATPSVSRRELQLVWPTIEDVRTSVIGYVSGTAIPCNAKNIKDFLPFYKVMSPTPLVGGCLAAP